MSTHVFLTPNDGPPIREVWAFISRDAQGQENVIGIDFGGLGMMLMMTANPKTFEIFL